MTDLLVPEQIPGWQMPYWDSLRAHDVRVQECNRCHVKRYVPKEICHACFSREWTWEPIAGTGTIYTYTTVERAPTPAYQEGAPYTLVHVEMTEGFRMIGRLTEVVPGKLAIDAPVHVAYRQIDDSDWTALYFELD